MADEEKIEEAVEKVEKGEASAKSPLVTVLLIFNAAAIGFIGWLQYQSHLNCNESNPYTNETYSRSFIIFII